MPIALTEKAMAKAAPQNDARSRIGARIRERRIDAGMRQTDLAQMAGISASYLNLIEHDRRRIGGKLLGVIARALDVDVQLLAEGADRRVLDAMRNAALAFPELAIELAQLDDMAGRYPGWGKLIATQAAQIKALDGRVQSLSDRLSHDPAFASSLHGIVSAVTAIRATASILISDEVIDADWLARFHRNINDDALRLADESRALVQYLEQPEDAPITPLLPAQELEDYLAAFDYHLPPLEQANVKGLPHMQLSGRDALGPAARDLLAQFAVAYAQGAASLPLKTFETQAVAANYDPLRLSQETGVALSVVMRRLACLPPGKGHPPFGLMVCDSGGYMQLMKPAADLVLPRQDLCPLWPIFTALGQPGRPVTALVALPGAMPRHFACHAIAEQIGSGSYDLPPMLRATILIQPDVTVGTTSFTSLGVACRICPRIACPARREASGLIQRDVCPKTGHRL